MKNARAVAPPAIPTATPADIPPGCRRFALLCHQRSGSNALDSWLSAHPHIGLYGQLFNNTPEYRASHAADLDMPLYRAHPESLLHFGLRPPIRARVDQLRLAMARRERDIDRYMTLFWQRFTHGRPWRAAGFKLHDFQLEPADLDRLLSDHVDAVILLSRRNLLKAAVAWAYAVRTQLWASRPPGESGPALELDVREIEWFLRKTRHNLDGWRATLAHHEVPTLDTTYERLMEAGDTASLMAFLGVEAHPDQHIATHRPAAPDYAHVSNARDIDRQLGSDDLGRLF